MNHRSPLTEARDQRPSALLSKALARVDYFDVFSLPIDAGIFKGQNPSIDSILYRFFDQTPGWVHALMKLRHALVRYLGLKVGSEMGSEAQKRLLREHRKFEKGDDLGLIQIFNRETDEIIVGADDKHLDFRVSFALCRFDAKPELHLVVGTAVQKHNTFGQFYFAIIRPFHRLIVPAMLQRTIRRQGKPAGHE